MRLLKGRELQDLARNLLTETHKYEDENIWFEVSVWESGAIAVNTHPAYGHPVMINLDLQSYDVVEEIIKDISSFTKYYQQEVAKKKGREGA